MKDLLRYADHFRRLIQVGMQPLRTQLGLSQLEADLLLFLHNNPELNTARDAVAYRGFAKSNVSTAVEALEEKGWLTVRPDPASRRVKRLVLRGERAEELARLAARQAELLSGIVAGFTPEEIGQFRSLLARMDENTVRTLRNWEEKDHA